MIDQKLVGSWKLVSFELEDLEGNREPWGKETHGLLIYAPTGHMSVSINKEIEPSGDGETQDIFDSILFYSGTYTVEGDLIRHQVTQASNPARIGKEMLRYAKFSHDQNGEQVELSTPKESFGRGILVWRRITS